MLSHLIRSHLGQWLPSNFGTCWPWVHLCQCLKILHWPVCWQMSLNESICGVSSPAIGWIFHGHPTCLTPGNHDESAPTAAPDCFLTFNSVSSCAWMNMGHVMDFWSNVLQQVGRRAPVSHGNYGGLDQYSRSSPPHNPHTLAILSVVQPLIQCRALWFFLLWSLWLSVPKSKDLLYSGDRERGTDERKREIWMDLIHPLISYIIMKKQKTNNPHHFIKSL